MKIKNIIYFCKKKLPSNAAPQNTGEKKFINCSLEKSKKRGYCQYIDIEALDRPPNNMYNSTTLLSIYTNNFTIISLCINRKEHLHLQYYYLLGEIVEISMSNNIKKRLCLTYKMLMKQHLAFHVRNKDTQKI